MARIILRKRDKINPDSPYLDVACLKKNQIVDILRDGQSLCRVGDAECGIGDWQAVFTAENKRHGKTIHTTPSWQVIEAPGVDPELLTGFLAQEPGDRVTNKMLQRRAFCFDFDTWLSNGGASLTLQKAMDYQKPVAKMSDPNVVGPQIINPIS